MRNSPSVSQPPLSFQLSSHLFWAGFPLDSESTLNSIHPAHSTAALLFTAQSTCSKAPGLGLMKCPRLDRGRLSPTSSELSCLALMTSVPRLFRWPFNWGLYALCFMLSAKSSALQRRLWEPPSPRSICLLR